MCCVFRVDEDNQHAPAAAEQMRQTSRRNASHSHHQAVDAASAAVNANSSTAGGSVTASEKNVVKVDASNDHGEKEVEYSCSMKVDSSFVADSLAPDYSDHGDAGEYGSAKQMPARSGEADIQRQSQASHVLKHTSQQPLDSAYVAPEQMPGRSGEADIQRQSQASRVLKHTSQQPLDTASVAPEHEQTPRQDNVTPVVSSRSTHGSMVSMPLTVFNFTAAVAHFFAYYLLTPTYI